MRLWGREDVVRTQQLMNISVLSFVEFLDVFRKSFPVSHLFPDAGLVGVSVLFVDHNTSIITSHKSRAGHPNMDVIFCVFPAILISSTYTDKNKP